LEPSSDEGTETFFGLVWENHRFGLEVFVKLGNEKKSAKEGMPLGAPFGIAGLVFGMDIGEFERYFLDGTFDIIVSAVAIDRVFKKFAPLKEMLRDHKIRIIEEMGIDSADEGVMIRALKSLAYPDVIAR
jgi:hypothetical protein